MLPSIISAILLILAFPNFNLSFLAFVGFVPLFFAVQNSTPKKAFLISYVCGFLFYIGVLYWLYHVTVFGLIALCLYLALYFGIFGWIFSILCSCKACFAHNVPLNRASSAATLVLISALWIALEYLQANFFSGFGWALLGYSQYKILPLIQIADFSSIYGVSFVIMMVNVAVYKAFKKSFKEIVITGIVFVTAIGYGMTRLNEGGEGNTIRISVIQGNIPQEMKWDPGAAKDILNKYINLTRIAAFDSPDLIIWPETSFPGYFVGDKEMTDQVLQLARKTSMPLLVGTNTEKDMETFNSAVLISERGKIIDQYDKIHLVPFGEYVPFSRKIPVLRNLVLGELGEFTQGEEYKVFTLNPCPVPERSEWFGASPLTKDVKFATLICFEDIFPKMSKRFVQNGAQFLVVITNDAWYGKSGAPYQHAACSVFRAIENRVPIVRCANTGYSCFIDSSGRIYDSVEEAGVHLFMSGHKTSTISLR